MNVKAQGLLNATKWIEESYGRDALRDVIRACSAPVRERYTSAIAITWHPLEELVELLEQADRQLGAGNGKIAEMIGEAGARANMRGLLLRLVFYISKPELMMKRVASLWRQFNDEGSMDLLCIEEHGLRVQMHGVRTPNALFCGVLTGWCREVVTVSGATAPHVKHVSCIARGEARCIWDIRYTGILEDAGKGGRGVSDSVQNLPTRPSTRAPSTTSDRAHSPSAWPARTSTFSVRPPKHDPLPDFTPPTRSSFRPPKGDA